MQMIDSQIHFYHSDSPERPWLDVWRGKPFPLGPNHFFPEDIIPQMDAAGVSRAVVVPPSWTGYDNSQCLEFAANDPKRFAVMGRFDLFDPDRGRLETWMEQPNMIGLRFSGRYIGGMDLGEFLDYEQFGWFWTECERLDIPVMMFASEDRIALVPKLAERFPGVTFIMDHFGTTIGDLNVIDPWGYQDQMLELAKFPNVYAKLSALPLNTLEEYPFPSQTPYIKRAYDAFGPERLAWGTDVSRFKRTTYQQAVDHILTQIDFLTEYDKEWIMGKTIAKAVRWPLDEDS